MGKKKNKKQKCGIFAAGTYVYGLTLEQVVSFTNVLDSFCIDYDVYYQIGKKKHKA